MANNPLEANDIFEIRYSRQAKKFLARCEPKLKQRLFFLFETLEQNPVPIHQFDVRKIEGKENAYRVRLSRFRALYEVFWEEKIIRVTKIERRDDETYK